MYETPSFIHNYTENVFVTYEMKHFGYFFGNKLFVEWKSIGIEKSHWSRWHVVTNGKKILLVATNHRKVRHDFR
jgi:hypothetical protein